LNRSGWSCSLFRHTLEVTGKNYVAHNNLGNALVKKSQIDEAINQLQETIEQFEAALRLNPDDAEVHYRLGLALARQGKRPEAAAQFSEALRLNPGYRPAREQLEALPAKR
jgi:protein O-mannosyl-transferase